MAVKVILEVQTKPGTGDELVALLRSILPETRAYEGCTGADALQNSDDSDNVAVVETWDSRELRKVSGLAAGERDQRPTQGSTYEAAEHSPFQCGRCLSLDHGKYGPTLAFIDFKNKAKLFCFGLPVAPCLGWWQGAVKVMRRAILKYTCWQLNTVSCSSLI
ncbi:MAG: antibiotic biosynthesis monooxygenase [Gammaproteobacteria bacterium]|nr:antibiotic biosynthesis monooxygenase [Gammaproteobacteria bacterium]